MDFGRGIPDASLVTGPTHTSVFAVLAEAPSGRSRVT